VLLRYYPIIAYLIELTLMVLLTTTAAIIFWRRSDDWMALFLVIGLVTYGVYVTPSLDALMAEGPAWQLIGNIFQAFGVGCAVFFFYLFPDGRFVPRWTRFLGTAWIVWAILWVVFPSSWLNFSQPFDLPFGSFLLLMGWWASGLYAQVYRYRRVSDPVEQQQTKWVVWGVALAVFGYGLYGPTHYYFTQINPLSLGAAVFQLTGFLIFLLCVFLVPLTFTFSILRYRLWDIDVIIRRTMVYGGLTATLIFVYLVTIILLQQLIGSITERAASPIAIAISTLAIAALFNPLRNRIQHDIDRRFYRQRYDADKIVADFSAGLRDQVDLDQIRDRLLVVLEDTLQPRIANLYLLESGSSLKDSAISSTTPEEAKNKDVVD
jgi:hypothetical protein